MDIEKYLNSRWKQEAKAASVCRKCGKKFKSNEKRITVGSAAMFANLNHPGFEMQHEKCPEDECD